MEKVFADKAAVVTGAGVGIGYEIARQLALNGAAVLLNDLDAALAEQAAAQICAEGGKCLARGGDSADVATVRGLVSAAVNEFGRLDIAVANAGLTSWGDFFDYQPETFERVLNVNLRGSYFLTQAAARQMRAQGSGGRIVLVSSVTGHQAVRYLSAYGMTKAALEMLARNLVIELSPYGITINAVAPGATLTPRNLADDPNYERIWGQITPTGRVGTPADIAQAVLFLASPQAGQITGQTLVVDGGWSATSPTPALDFVEKKT
ncbi:MAG: SDR family oxidoreductase [Chloroflexi bacterium]|nr:SDR family oxidoreductase [Chloroflexota bacterium]